MSVKRQPYANTCHSQSSLSSTSDSLDIAVSESESEYVSSETSEDRAFLASETDELRYYSDGSSDHDPLWDETMNKDVDESRRTRIGVKIPTKTVLKRTFRQDQGTCYLVLWYSWEIQDPLCDGE
ncbi:hypothetical protein N7466_011113 [Penicillium verhagenii]|uniref:uncharacterized protein n=1 Tax=Penicillium verhagenii TaxID=1562060 RepID=UPI0025455221|nr:uncharacterized protein N7466_011113 [Penicillium verhagenii]KAJ5917559.1 hypothetical protein N7466_011113 [Penicillium verhagenii]